jgi:hypothetical protein
MDRLNASMNGESRPASVPKQSEEAGAIEKIHKVQYLVPAESIGTPLAGRDVLETVQRSLNAFPSVMNDVKDVLRGVEADVRSMDTIQIVEEPNKRTLTIQRKIRIRKDR